MLTLVTTAVPEAAAEVTHAAAASGIGALGLDPRALVFQIINFTILSLLLQRFAYKPIVKILEQRRRTITESLKTAAALEQAKHDLAGQARAARAAAQAQAQAILAESKQQAATLVKDAEARATARAAQLTAQAEAKISQEVAAVKRELKQETLTLVALASEKLLNEKLDTDKDSELIKQALAAVERGRHL